MTATEIRAYLRANIAAIDTTYLDHEAGVRNGIHYCHCGYRGNESEWLQHLADKIADATTERVVQLPLEVVG